VAGGWSLQDNPKESPPVTFQLSQGISS
jgi:hypothetical protein